MCLVRNVQNKRAERQIEEAKAKQDTNELKRATVALHRANQSYQKYLSTRKM